MLPAPQEAGDTSGDALRRDELSEVAGVDTSHVGVDDSALFGEIGEWRAATTVAVASLAAALRASTECLCGECRRGTGPIGVTRRLRGGTPT